MFITPTATMAEHVRNELARAGVPVRPGRVATFARFLDAFTDLAAAPEPVLHLLVEQALERLRPEGFVAVMDYPGFHFALAALMEEVPREALGGVFGTDLARVFQDVKEGLKARGMGLRNARLQDARTGPSPTAVFDGFFSFSHAELEFIEGLAAHSQVTVTLPDWPGAENARRRLLARGFAEVRMTEVHRKPRRDAFSAATLERETEEIARRILEYTAKGRNFRDMGIVLRVRDPYGPALETTLARFGIPARFYFSDPLSAHPAIVYLSGAVRAMLGGWDHAAMLTLLRMPVSGIGATPAGDRFDFALRETIPSAGFPAGLDEFPDVLHSFTAMDAWRNQLLEPLDWAVRLKTLRTLIPQPAISDRVSWEQVHIWRAASIALDAFHTQIDQTAEALAGVGRIGLARFWRQVEAALALEKLRVPDRRRDVVHVMDVYEARQWELPVVFVCGMMERHFPPYHREDPLLNDAARARAGLRTSFDQQREERFLFDFALTRSTAEIILSYARLNDKGEDTLPSFFLAGQEGAPAKGRVRPAPLRATAAVTPAPIQHSELLAKLAQKHKSLAPTSIESFLQCPFQFFAARTLRLRRRPPALRDRLDVLAQGSILHRALAELTRMPLLGAAMFDQVFDDECDRRRIPANYRTEAVRLQMRRHFESFLADRQVALGWSSRVEEKFSLPLSPLLTITGRIDRLDTGPGNQAVVIDYKYSGGNKIRERVEDTDSGALVQGGLYLLAAEREFGLEPAGMLYCGLRNDVVWGGWHLPIRGLEQIGEASTPAVLRELMNAAAAKAVEVSEAIAGGHIAAHPADSAKCLWCDFADICRVESLV